MKTSKLIAFAITAMLSLQIHAQQYAGDWSGKLNVQGVSIPVVFHINQENKNYTATMDSPDQRAFGLVVKSVTATQQQIILEMPDLGIRFEGTIETDSLKGNFIQGGQSFILNLGKATRKTPAPSRRPQNPKPKYNYEIQEVTFVNEKANIKLAGTLTLPKGKGPFPAVVLVSGSGPQNRDEEMMGHRPFWVIADYLTKKGIAVLRYDDRGTYHSEGNFSASTSADFAADAQAALAFLRTKQNIDQKKIGVIGHSEGGMIAPMLAASDANIGFIILLAGPGIPIDQLMIKQSELISRSAGMSKEKISETLAVNEKCYAILKQEADSAKAASMIFETLEPSIGDSVVSTRFATQLTSPWYRYFITYDPQPALEKVKCPVLAINGDKDLQVTAKENLAGIKKSLEKGGNQHFEIREMKNMNHLFQTTENGAVSEYDKIEETFSPEVLKIMADWIKNLE